MLHLHAADLLDPNSFDAAFADVEAVIHTASPVNLLTAKNPQKELIEPAVQGTEAVLQSVSRHPKIKRVVLTSSIAAVNNGEPLDRPLNESDWNNRTVLNYQTSKSLAEQKAWELAKNQSQYSLIVINPGVIIGPNRSDRTGFFSYQLMHGLLSGRFRLCVPYMVMHLVDVRDVAEIHIRALTETCAKGRYIAVSYEPTLLEMAKKIREMRPDLKWKLPWFTLPTFLAILFAPLTGLSWKEAKTLLARSSHQDGYDGSKLRNDFSFSYLPLNKTLSDMAASISPPKKS